ncbi:MAG: hypothetical protein WC549_08195 [Actinomycetota bacterium]
MTRYIAAVTISMIQLTELNICIVKIRTGIRKKVATILRTSGFLNLGFIIVMITSPKPLA